MTERYCIRKKNEKHESYLIKLTYYLLQITIKNKKMNNLGYEE